MKEILFFFLVILSCPTQAQNLNEVTLRAQELAKNKEYDQAIDLLVPEIESYKNENGITPPLIQAVMVQGKASIYKWDWEKAEQFYVEAREMSDSIKHDSLYIESTFSNITVFGFRNKIAKQKELTEDLLSRDDLNFKQRSNLNAIYSSCFENEEKLDSAIYYSSIAAKIDSIHQDSSSLPFTYYELGNLYIANFDYESGISKILYGLSFLRGERDGHKKASIEVGLGKVYYNIGNISKAKSLARSALTYAQKADLHVTQTMAYSLLGDCENYHENYELALDYYMKSDSVNSVRLNNARRGNKARINIINTKLELGETVSNEEINQLKEIRRTTEVSSFKNRIDLVMLRTEDYSISEFEQKYNQLYSKNYSSAISHSKRSLLKIKKEFYQKKGLFREALTIDKQLDSLNRDILQTTNNFAIQDLDARYSKNQQDIEIQYLDDQNKSQVKLVSQQRALLGFGAFSLLAVSILSYFMFTLYKRTKGQKETIAKTLQEKDILLREIHHRVKNNLQLVSSLLTMQGRSITDVTALEAINEGKSRVRSMALIHQDLYNKENLTGIGVKEYIESLTEELFQTYRIDEDRIRLDMNIEDIELDVDTMVPLGLIINELITNSLKYAFPDSQAGALSVSLNEAGDLLRLEVSDDGIGYVSQDSKVNTFGSTLISALTEQLGGELNTTTTNGTKTEIAFSDYTKSVNVA